MISNRSESYQSLAIGYVTMVDNRTDKGSDFCTLQAPHQITLEISACKSKLDLPCTSNVHRFTAAGFNGASNVLTSICTEIDAE
jgi:hypothetical protein